MKTSLVAQLALTALVGVQLGPMLSAQDAGARAPRPRAGAHEDDASARRPRARVGAPLNRLLRRAEPPHLGLFLDDGDDGLRVTQVEEGSLVEAAGVQVGDLLLRLDGQTIGDIEDIRAILTSTQPGQTISMGVVREGEGLVKLEVRLPEQKPRTQDRAAPQPDGHKGGFLGVELGEADDAGVVVSEVLEGTAAWFAGLEGGDVLRSIDGHAIEGPQDVVGAVSSREPGSMVTLTYSRQGKDQTATVRLGHRASQALGLLQPGSGMLFPEAFSRPDGNVMLLPGQGQHTPRRFQFFGNDGLGFSFDGGDVDWRGHLNQLDGSIQGWMKQLHEQLEGLDLDDGQQHELSIRIEDGVMTIDEDGETHVIDLNDAEASEAIEEALEGVNLQILPRGVLFPGPANLAPGVQPDVRVLRLGDGDCAVPCEIRQDGCEADASAAPASTADIL